MATQFVTKEDLNYAAQKQKEVFVAKEAGKSLVPNTQISKLGTIEENAQVNVVETIKVNGTPLSVANKEVNIAIQTPEQIEQAIKNAVTGVYRVKGSSAFEELPTTAEVGDMYNITNTFTTTAAFVEGAGNSYPAGTNVVWTAAEKWDCMAGLYDFSDFMRVSDISEITENEIDDMYK